MRKNILKNTFINAFNFLWDEFQFVVISDKKEDWGYTMEAKNAVAGVRITYEYREAYANIMIYKLINGQIVENTTKAILSNEKINGFSVDRVIAMLNPDDLQKPYYPKQAEVNEECDLYNYLSEVASKTRKYAKDILAGDFSIFDKLDSKVKEEYHNYYK